MFELWSLITNPESAIHHQGSGSHPDIAGHSSGSTRAACFGNSFCRCARGQSSAQPTAAHAGRRGEVLGLRALRPGSSVSFLSGRHDGKPVGVADADGICTRAGRVRGIGRATVLSATAEAPGQTALDFEAPA